MTEKDINKCLKNGISQIAPDCFDEIMKKIESKKDVSNPVKTTKRWLHTKKISYLLSMAAVFGILVGAYGFYQYDLQKITTVIELDVNPSIEFCASKEDRIVEVKALNGDGENIIENLSLEKENIEKATLTVMDELVAKGFITKEKATVLVSVENENEKKTEKLKESLSKEIVKHLEKDNIRVNVLKQTIVKDEISETIAQEYGISHGKALLVKTMLAENADLKEEELARMTVDEIAKQAKQDKVNLGKLLNEKGSEEQLESKKKGQKITAEKETFEVSNGEHKKSQTEVSKSRKEAKPTKTPEASGKTKPTRPPEGNEKTKPTKTPEGNENSKPTRPPEGDEKAKPTKAPEGHEKSKPTKAPEGDEKSKPTKAPEGDEKSKPTKTPEGDERLKPTRPPENDDKRPPQNPKGDEKAKPTRLPENDEKRPPQNPEGDERLKPTRPPENDDRRSPQNPDGDEKEKPRNVPDSEQIPHDSDRKRK